MSANLSSKTAGGTKTRGKQPAAGGSASRSSRVLRRIVTFGVWALLFAPLIFLPQTIYPGMVGKTIFFRIGVEILLVPYLALTFLDPEFRPRPSPLLWSVAAYLGALLITTLTSADRYLSWWGNMAWMEGVFGFLHYVLFFVILAAVFRAERDWLNFFKVSSIVSFLVAGLSVAVELTFRRHDLRIGSTIGHYAYAAAYLLFQIFFAAILLHWERKLAWRVWAAAVIALDLVALGLTADRGATVGLCAGLVAMAAGVLLFAKDRPRLRQASIALVVLLALAIPVVRLAKGTRIVEWNFFLSRLSKISLADETTRSRLIGTGVSWRAFKARPLLGYGPEVYSLAYYHNFNPEQLTYDTMLFERAHNKLFDVLVMEGLVGFIPYVAIFVAVAWMLRLALKKTRFDTITILLTAGMLVAYFVQNLFLFDTPTSYMMIFALLAFVQFLAGDDHPTPEPVPRSNSKEPKMVLITWQRAVITVAAVLTIVSVYQFNVKPFAEAWYGRSFVDATDDPDKFLRYFEKALSYHSWPSREVDWTAAQVLTKSYAARQPQFSKASNEVAAQLESLIRRGDIDPQTYFRLGTLYDEMAYTDPSFLSKAENVLKAGIRLAPDWPEGYYELATNYLRAGRPDDAIAASKWAVSLNPRCGESLWNHAFMLMKTHHEREGLAELDLALTRYAYHTHNALIRLVYTYYHYHDVARAIQYQKELIELEPGEAQHHAVLARLYLDSGDKASAAREIEGAAQLDPRYSSTARQFLRGLESNNPP